MDCTNLIGFAQFADFKLIHDHGSVYINSSILSAVSPVIKTALSVPNPSREFTLPHSPPTWQDSTSEFLSYLFGKEISLTDDTVPFLYLLAATLEIQSLLADIEVFFRNHGVFAWVVNAIRDFHTSGLRLEPLYPILASHFEGFLEHGYLWDYSGEAIRNIICHPSFRVISGEVLLRFLIDQYTMDPIGYREALSVAANRYFCPFVLQLLEKCPSFDFRDIKENLVNYLARMPGNPQYSGLVTVPYINGRYDGVLCAIGSRQFKSGADFTITASASFSPKYGPDNLRSFDTENYFCSAWHTFPWITIEFIGLQLQATVYVLKGCRHSTLSNSPSNWNLDGSNDGTTWSRLDTVISDRQIGTSGIGLYRIRQITEAYTFFRFSVNPSDVLPPQIILTGIELFGIVREWSRSLDSPEGNAPVTGDLW
jgi:hypothetical protein